MENKGTLHKGHRQRLKNRAKTLGLENMPYHEVLELILTYTIPYKDVNPLAHELIERFGSLAGVLDAGYEQLIKIDGVGKETAMFLTFLPEMFNKYRASRNMETTILSTTSSCLRYFRSIAQVKRIEEFFVFCLDSRQKLIKTVKIASGQASSVSFDVSKFSESIVAEGIMSIIIMHIHPNGNVLPTKADLIATKRLIAICCIMGIKVEDHIIVSEEEYFSFKSNLMFDKLKVDTTSSLLSTIGVDEDQYTAIIERCKKK